MHQSIWPSTDLPVICLSFHPSLSIHTSFITSWIHSSVYPSVCQSIHPSTYVYTHPSIYPSVNLSVHLSIYSPMHPSVCPSSIQPYLHVSICLSMHPSIVPSAYPFTYLSFYLFTQVFSDGSSAYFGLTPVLGTRDIKTELTMSFVTMRSGFNSEAYRFQSMIQKITKFPQASVLPSIKGLMPPYHQVPGLLLAYY